MMAAIGDSHQKTCGKDGSCAFGRGDAEDPLDKHGRRPPSPLPG